MPANLLKRYLDKCGIKYVSIMHSPAFTAQEVAESVHVAGRDFAKTVMVKIEEELAMVVLPANRKIVIADLRELLGCDHLRLASESEFNNLFPDCEAGAMPPFGNLYRIPVYVAAELGEEKEIAFNAGTHTEVIKLAYEDFEQLVKPQVVDFVTM